jgi:RNA polymerase sigma-70 factor (ECF subfamily)
MITSEEDKVRIGQMYENHRHQLWYCAYSYVGEAEAEDMVQEVILEMMERLSGFAERSDRELYAYAVMLTKSRCVDLLRRKQLHRKLSLDTMLEAGFDWHTTEGRPEEVICGKDTARILAGKIAGMKPEYQDLIRYRFLEDMNSKQIAEMTNISVNLVDQRICRIRRRLKTTLREAGYSV